MLLSALSILVIAQSSSEIPEGLMNNPVCSLRGSWALVPNETVTFDPSNKHNGPPVFVLVVQQALCHVTSVLC